MRSISGFFNFVSRALMRDQSWTFSKGKFVIIEWMPNIVVYLQWDDLDMGAHPNNEPQSKVCFQKSAVKMFKLSVKFLQCSSSLK